jgi:sulfite reductase alpha subunit-like flavoprotein
MQLDDFLELKHAAFTKCLVIFVSSYGVGQAPLGAYRFRELCDYWAQNDDHGAPLQGLQYALCGLGDSTYPTKFVNPTRIDRGLTAAGARRIGQLAMADAHGSGQHAQDVTISNWIQDVWLPLAQQLTKTEPLVDTLKMQQATIPLLIQLDPDYQPPKEFRTRGDAPVQCSPMVLAGLAVAGIGAAVLALHFH